MSANELGMWTSGETVDGALCHIFVIDSFKRSRKVKVKENKRLKPRVKDFQKEEKINLLRGLWVKSMHNWPGERGIPWGSGKEAGDTWGLGENNFGLNSRACTWFPARVSLALRSTGACGHCLAGFRGITGWNAKAVLRVQLC